MPYAHGLSSSGPTEETGVPPGGARSRRRHPILPLGFLPPCLRTRLLLQRPQQAWGAGGAFAIYWLSDLFPFCQIEGAVSSSGLGEGRRLVGCPPQLALCQAGRGGLWGRHP